MTKTIQQLQADVQALDDLLNSRGWEILKETIGADVMAAAFAFANNPLMSEKEIDFRRGAIWSAQNLLTVPDKIRQTLANDLAIKAALAATPSPAPAGSAP